jgi:hypothetical protein
MQSVGNCGNGIIKEREGNEMKKCPMHFYQVAELKGGMVYAYIKAFPTEAEARENIKTRTAGEWIVNRVEGYYRTNGMFKRTGCVTL